MSFPTAFAFCTIAAAGRFFRLFFKGKIGNQRFVRAGTDAFAAADAFGGIGRFHWVNAQLAGPPAGSAICAAILQ